MWDQKIRRQIKDCALFIPVISKNTDARSEGYFRLEWKLAVDRSHLMAEDAPFLVPIVIDDTLEAAARVPERFRDAQWTRILLAESPAQFSSRIVKLLAGEPAAPSPRPSPPAARRRSSWAGMIALAIIVVAALVAILAHRRGTPAGAGPTPASTPAPAPALSESRQKLNQALNLMRPIDSTIEDYHSAESILKRAGELDPSDGEIWAASALLNGDFHGRGFDISPERLAQARSLSERGIKLAPKSALAWLAHSRGDAGNSAASIRDLQHALTLAAPGDDWIRSRCYFGLGMNRNLDRKAAFAYLEKSILPGVPGSDALAHYAEFLRYFQARQFPEADAIVARAAAELPTVNFVCGRALSQLVWHGDTAGAMATMAKLSPERLSEPRAVLFRIQLAIFAHQPDAALDVIQHTPILYIDDNYFTGPMEYWRGWAAYEKGNQDAAAELWARAYAACLRQDADHTPDARTLTTEAELLGWLGRGPEAQRILAMLQSAPIDGWRGGPLRVAAALGQVEAALPLIRGAMQPEQGFWPLTSAQLRIDPLWDKLRADPRFQALANQQN